MKKSYPQDFDVIIFLGPKCPTICKATEDYPVCSPAKLYKMQIPAARSKGYYEYFQERRRRSFEFKRLES